MLSDVARHLGRGQRRRVVPEGDRDGKHRSLVVTIIYMIFATIMDMDMTGHVRSAVRVRRSFVVRGEPHPEEER